MNIQPLLDRHEAFKKKWLQNNESTLFDWVMLWEEILDARTILKSEYQEERQQLEIEKGIKKIELKSEVDEKWKKIHTEATSDAIIDQKFNEKDQFISLKKLQIESLENKVAVISEYINLVKLSLKK